VGKVAVVEAVVMAVWVAQVVSVEAAER